MQFTDRYQALGIPYPDPETMCKGPCEGIGYYPSQDKSEWPADAVSDEHGWVFVKCPICGGTGKAKEGSDAKAE